MGVAGAGEHDDADRFRCVPGGRPDLELDVTERQALTVVERFDGEPGATGRCRAVRDDRARGLGQLEVAGQEVGMEVRLDDALDAQAGGRCVVEVLGDVSLRVDHHGTARGLVADQVRGVREAPEVVLLEEHVRSLPG